MALERLQKQIDDLLLVINLRRQTYDKATRACKNLLKPWPRKSHENVDEQEHNSEEKAASIHPQEEEELKLVCTILSKAHRTRVKTLSKSQHVEEAENTLDVNNERQQDIREDTSRKDIKAENIPGAIASRNGEDEKMGRRRADIKIGKEKQHQRKQENTIFPKAASKNLTKLSASCRNGFVKNSNKATLSSAADIERAARSADGSHSNKSDNNFYHRPTSQPRPGSSQSKLRPAHVTAPFKTDPSLHPSKRLSTKKGVSTGGNLCKGVQFDNKCLPQKILPPISIDLNCFGPIVQTSYTSQKQPSPGETMCFNVGSTSDSSQVTAFNKNAAICLPVASELGDCPPVSKKLDVCESALEGRKIGACIAMSINQNPKEDVHCFTLLKDGHNLRVPPKVQRSFARNWQLRLKAQQQTARKPREEKGKRSHNGTDFAHKLEQLFDIDAELLLVQRAMQCLSSHKQLAALLAGLTLDSISASSEIKEILHAKVVAEFVLSAFSSLSEDAKIFSKTNFPHAPSALVSGVKESRVQDLQTHIDHDDAVTSMKYTTVKDLHHYTKQRLQVQNLQYEKCLVSIMTSDVVPWLEELNRFDEQFSSIFQGIFSLVTSGQHFPALVQDERV